MGSAVGSQRDCCDPSAALLDRRLLRPRYEQRGWLAMRSAATPALPYSTGGEIRRINLAAR